MTDEVCPAPVRTRAVERSSRWPGWIWAFPIAALGVVVWLLGRSFATQGVEVTVAFENAAGIKPNDTQVMYRGYSIGSVRDLSLSEDRRQVIARLDLNDRIEKDLTRGTRFYLQGAEPSLSDPSSLKSIVTGPTIVMLAGEGAAERHFIGIAGSPPDVLAVSVPYLINFHGDVGQLRSGAPVTLRGFKIGQVTGISLDVDAADGTIRTPVMIALDPTRLHIQHLPLSAAPGDWGAALNGVLSKLVVAGLRARLGQSPPVVGGAQITLELQPSAKPASLTLGGTYPEIPAEEDPELQDIINQINQLPIKAIGDGARALLQHANEVIASPQLRSSLSHLDSALAEIEKSAHQAGPQIGPLIGKLRDTAEQIDAGSQAARQMIRGGPTVQEGNLQQALQELSKASRSVRMLADDLDRHPESLLRGRR